MNRIPKPRLATAIDMTCVALWATAAIILAGCGRPEDVAGAVPTTAQALTPALSELPEGPPDEYVVTPSGRYHRSCVHTAPSGSTVNDNGDVIVDGRLVEHHEPCRYRSYRAARASTGNSTGSGIVPAVNGWIESARTYGFTNSWGFNWFNGLVSTTRVPAAPRSFASQSVFVFSSLEPANLSAIIQPVLQWGPSQIGGGNRWTAGAWYVTSTGGVMMSTPVTVNSGDTIIGSLVAVPYSCSAAGVCQWQMTMYRNGTLITWLVVSTSQTFGTAQKAVLEAHNLTACNQLPNQVGVSFYDIRLYMPGPDANSYNDVASSVPWVKQINPVTPDCSYSVILPSGSTVGLAADGQHI